MYYWSFFSKYIWVFPLKDKKCITIVNAFEKVLDTSDHKPNKIWVDKGSQFYNSSFKKWSKEKDIKIIQHIMKENLLLLRDLLQL